MSETVDQFCENLRVKLTGMENRLSDFQTEVKSDRESMKAAIDVKIDETKASLNSAKDDAQAARSRMSAMVEEKKAETKDEIAQWKHNREVGKLERRAEDLEAYAIWAVLVAADALDEADLATLQAISARLDADYVAAS